VTQTNEGCYSVCSAVHPVLVDWFISYGSQRLD